MRSTYCLAEASESPRDTRTRANLTSSTVAARMPIPSKARRGCTLDGGHELFDGIQAARNKSYGRTGDNDCHA